MSCSLALHLEIRKHVGHGRLMQKVLAERFSLADVQPGREHSAAHYSRAARRAVKTRERHHVHDGPHAPTVLADEVSHSIVVLHLARGVRAVADLVLQAHHPEAFVGLAVLQHPGN